MVPPQGSGVCGRIATRDPAPTIPADTAARPAASDQVPIAFAVAIPARNEASRIATCIRAIRDAANATPAHVTVTVACDSSVDATFEVARCAAGGDGRFVVLRGDWGSAGAARAAAASDALSRLCGSADATWLLSTDADTIVPRDWFATVAARAGDGVEALAGIVELTRDHDWSPHLEAAFSLSYDVGARTHPHVHAANLAVRRDAYEAAGGFAPVPCGEDHDLWRALRAAGRRCVPVVSWRVSTSGRLRGRAPGGFADRLAERLSLPDAAGA